MRRFAVSVSGLTKTHHKELIRLVKEKNLSWWHWIDDLWLIVDKQDRYTAAEIRDWVKAIAPPTARCIVLQVNETTSWAGFGPKGPKPMFQWIKDVWFKSSS